MISSLSPRMTIFLAPSSLRLLQRGDERPVLGDVVGRPADEAAERDQRRPVRRPQDHADPRRPRIPAAAAVELEGDGFFHRERGLQKTSLAGSLASRVRLLDILKHLDTASKLAG